MKRLALGSPTSQQDFNRWAESCFREIERASAEDIEQTLMNYSTTGVVTEQRTFNAATATATELRNVLATIIQDVRRGGSKRRYAS